LVTGVLGLKQEVTEAASANPFGQRAGPRCRKCLSYSKLLSLPVTLCLFVGFIPVYGVPDDVLGFGLVGGAFFRVLMYVVFVGVLVLMFYGKRRRNVCVAYTTWIIFCGLCLLVMVLVRGWLLEIGIRNRIGDRNQTSGNFSNGLNVTLPSDVPVWATCSLNQSLGNESDRDTNWLNETKRFLHTEIMCLSDIMKHQGVVMIVMTIVILVAVFGLFFL
jgi:hypothetical protein